MRTAKIIIDLREDKVLDINVDLKKDKAAEAAFDRVVDLIYQLNVKFIEGKYWENNRLKMVM